MPLGGAGRGRDEGFGEPTCFSSQLWTSSTRGDTSMVGRKLCKEIFTKFFSPCCDVYISKCQPLGNLPGAEGGRSGSCGLGIVGDLLPLRKCQPSFMQGGGGLQHVLDIGSLSAPSSL